MKSVILALVAFAAVGVSAAQDTSGCQESADGKYVTCKVPALYGDGSQSTHVTFRIRGGSVPVQNEEQCAVGEAMGSCPQASGIPHWLEDLNAKFKKAGFSAPKHPEDQLSPGGN